MKQVSHDVDSAVPVLICTGHGEPERTTAMLDAGPAGVLMKPFSVEEVRRAIAGLSSTFE